MSKKKSSIKDVKKQDNKEIKGTNNSKQEDINLEHLKKKNKKIIIVVSILIFAVLFITLLTYFLSVNKEYLISFNSDGGTAVENISTINNGNVDYPSETPMKDGYIFNGWLLDYKLLIQGTKIKENTEVKASWVDIGYDYVHVVYSAGDGFEDIDTLVEKNQRAIQPNIPIAKNKTFKGWYLNNSEFDFDARINENIILIAKWEENKKTNQSNNCIDSSFELKDDNCVKEISLKPTTEYYCKDGWELVGKNCVKPDLTGNYIDATPNYICSNGYTLSNNKCLKELTSTPTSSYKCSTGVLEGDTCYIYKEKMVSYQAFTISGYTQAQINKFKSDMEIYCSNKKGRIEYGNNYFACYVTEKIANGSAQLQMQCPSEYSLSNGVCKKTHTIDATVQNYTCPIGYINSETKCYEKSTTVQKEEAESNLKCYEGFELKDNKCVSKISLKKVN